MNECVFRFGQLTSAHASSSLGGDFVKDPRIQKLAHNLVNQSVRLKPGERVLIEVTGFEVAIINALIKEVYLAGGQPFVSVNENEILRELLLGADAKQLAKWAEWDVARMKAMDAYIGIRAGSNMSQMKDVPGEQMDLYQKNYALPVHFENRIQHTRWVVLRYPNHAMAQLADMSTEAFEDFYFDVCNLDYSKMDRAMDALKARMEKTDQVHIKGPGTDLTFSIKGLPAIKCSGQMNIPDGEIYTAPVKNSVNGKLSYNTPSLYQGFTFENIVFEFKDGKIISAHSNDDERITKVLNTDEGARYIGEFAIGVNPFIEKPMRDTLFDEKIKGSFHFTPGNAYDDAFNGNKSAIHWDLVCIQTEAYGGGEMYFDKELVRKNGRFVPADLQLLNPENLK
jgi:aminopeptidase